MILLVLEGLWSHHDDMCRHLLAIKVGDFVEWADTELDAISPGSSKSFQPDLSPKQTQIVRAMSARHRFSVFEVEEEEHHHVKAPSREPTSGVTPSSEDLKKAVKFSFAKQIED